MKNRWWWTFADSKDSENINFLWTQTKKKFFFTYMKESTNPKTSANNNTSNISKGTTKSSLYGKDFFDD